MTPRLAVGIGVQRGGTSWLHRALEEHPSVSGARVPNNKELDFLTAHWDRGQAWYRSLFPADAPVALEFSVSYFPSVDATARLRAVDPDARVLVCLRDPVDRVVSQYRFFLARGAAPVPFHRALAGNASMEDQSRYGTHLQRWVDAVGPERVHVVLHDDIAGRPRDVVAGACGFLGLEPHAPTVLESRINAPDRPDRVALRRAMSRTAAGMRRVGGARFLQAAERTGVPDRLRARVREDAPPPFDDRDHEALADLRARLAPEVRHAQELVGRDLSAWLPG